MHFRQDPEDERFREEVRAFLRARLPADVAERNRRGFHPTKEDELWWTRVLYERGWSAPHWPVEYGGTGWSPLRRFIFEEECFLAGAPPTCAAGFSLLGPVLYTYGNEDQKQRFLEPTRRGDIFWGQLFSEPNAGSDLASLKTIAVLDGDHYIVNGQKTWTTEGHYADWLFCLVRTDTESKPQRGISFLIIDAKAPGVTVRPIVSLDESHSLNETFLDNVRVPAANRIGEENKGWSYAKLLLEHERAFSAEVPRNKRLMAQLKQIAKTQRSGAGRLIDDPVFSARIAEAEIELRALEWLTLRALADMDHGADPTKPVGSVLKVRGSELIQKIGALIVEALGDHGQAFYPEHGFESLPGPAEAPGQVADFLYRRAVTIYGGTNEIQRNLIARGLLGL
ncbi:acyl-CoA dehydrogenase family protein [Hydrocarboniphaga effusa]|uniref:Acyl-CoA dehydrogenase domain protein n=1 Tax=Hydrocarboniphaga effusa AP103 TaxID=1172194 RepID=I7ZGE3_9GAMM|nr:acyl-CoA dehydrogenase family protein [Hydrocarboniphaga effusa]EIT70802.1 acyl-CoA dehydrogenase domain protein [Hydrocarboniphaga effusa AP103]